MNIGIVSCNINCNFTNYGSALQSWALSQTLSKLGHFPILIDYCPDTMRDKDPLNPIKNMWDTDAESRRMCELSMPAIRINYEKFERFYTEKFNRTTKKYYSESFEAVQEDEHLSTFVCGSDTIFCIEEFGIDDGYYANYPCMKNGYTISYAASFGDSRFTPETYSILNNRLQNFKAIGIRESGMLDYIKSHTGVRAEKVIDPTLLLTTDEYASIEAPRLIKERYILLYARRYNKQMFEYADKKAKELGCTVVDISLRATNADKHRMFYTAGVEEFLSLVRHAEFVVTNSFHGTIFAVQYQRPFVVFTREQSSTKIHELLELFGIPEQKMCSGDEAVNKHIDYTAVHERIQVHRITSLRFLQEGLTIS